MTLTPRQVRLSNKSSRSRALRQIVFLAACAATFAATMYGGFIPLVRIWWMMTGRYLWPCA